MNTLPTPFRPVMISRACKLLSLGVLSCIAIGSTGLGLAHAEGEAAPPMLGATQDEEPAAPVDLIGRGDASRAWLSRQASRTQASKTRQTLSGPVMSAVNARYVNSFKEAIPPSPSLRDETRMQR